MILAWLYTAAAAEPLALTYVDALRRASEANPTVLGAAQDVLSAEGALLAARATFGPALSGRAGYASGEQQDLGVLGDSYSSFHGWDASATLSQALPTGTAVGVTFADQYSYFYARSLVAEQTFESEGAQYEPSLALTLTQSLLQGWKLSYNLQAIHGAQSARSVTEARQMATRQTAIADAAKAYWALHRARRGVEIATRAEDAQREQERVVRALVEAGKLAPVDATRSAAAVAQAERSRLDAESTADAAADALLVVLGESPGQPVELLTPPAPPTEVTLDEEQVIAAVLGTNLDLLAARLSVEASARAATDARHALLPQLDANASYTLSGSDSDQGTSWAELGKGALTGWSVGGTFSVPLGNRADRGALAQREAEATKAQLDLHLLEASLAQAARVQVRTIRTARRAVELAELNVRLAEETAAVETARLAEGKALQRDVIQAVSDVAAAQVAREDAVIQFHAAVVELERLKGAL